MEIERDICNNLRKPLKKCFPLKFCRYQRAKPVIIDPGLYTVQKSDVFWVPEKRNVPTAYKLFTGEYFCFFCFSF